MIKLDKLIQGSAKDQLRNELVELNSRGILQFNVHDECGYSSLDEVEVHHMCKIICGAVEILVPLRCDMEAGPSYDSLAKLPGPR